MNAKNMDTDKLITEYNTIKHKIIERINEFRTLWKTGTKDDLFFELIFCLLTPQSKAKICWETVENIKKK